MKIAAICCVRNEADVIGLNLRHLLREGVDRILISEGHSTDATHEVICEVCEEHPYATIQIFMDANPIFLQTERINFLADHAAEQGADWILPFDADEFFHPVRGYSDDGLNIAATLKQIPEDVRKLYCLSWQHLDWENRLERPLSLHKVVYRPTPGARLTMGQHEVSVPGGMHGVLEVRHLQYRSFEHFVAKVRDYNQRIDPVEVAKGNGAHITRLRGFTDEQLREEWEAMQGVATVRDPIPVGR